jgi:uncharacterized protein (DUF885 family)
MKGVYTLKSYKLRRVLTLFLVVLFLVASFSGCNQSSKKVVEEPKESTEPSEKDAEVIQKEFDAYCESLAKRIIEESPLNASFMYSDLESLGLEELLYQLDDASDEAVQKQIEDAKDVIEYLESIKLKDLTEEQKKTYRMLEFQNTAVVDGEDYIYYTNAFQPTSGVQINLPITLMQIELESEKEVQAYIERVKQLPRLFDQFIDYEKTRAGKGLFLPAYMYDIMIEQLNELLKEPDQFMMYLSFSDRVDMLDELSDPSKSEYKKNFLDIITNDIYPSYDRIEAALEEIKTQSTNTLGLPEWENGQTYYDYLVGFYTSYDMDTEDLRYWAQVEFNKNYTNYQSFLESHPEITDQELTDFFNKVNSIESLYTIEEQFVNDAFLDYGVERASENIIPPYLEEHLPPAFYFPISIDGEDYGNMYMAEEAFNNITMDTLVTDIHENIPGHHLYFSVLYNSDLPLIRKVYDFATYTEGWAQYVQDKTYQYAATNEEIADFWSNYIKMDGAMRVLLDILVNYDGIPKEEAFKLMFEMGYDQEGAEAAYNRMLANPGELINYFYGSNVIESYLIESQEALGESFDIKSFHDLILKNGGLPFFVMDDVVKDYIRNNR